MRGADDDITQRVRPEGTPPMEDPEPTIVERMHLQAQAGPPIDRRHEEFQSVVTERIEPEPSMHAVYDPPGRPPLPSWVLPYMIACITLTLAGAFVLWTQARILGHF